MSDETMKKLRIGNQVSVHSVTEAWVRVAIFLTIDENGDQIQLSGDLPEGVDEATLDFDGDAYALAFAERKVLLVVINEGDTSIVCQVQEDGEDVFVNGGPLTYNPKRCRIASAAEWLVEYPTTMQLQKLVETDAGERLVRVVTPREGEEDLIQFRSCNPGDQIRGVSDELGLGHEQVMEA